MTNPHAEGGAMFAKANSSYRFVTALVRQEGRYLITQRKAG